MKISGKWLNLKEIEPNFSMSLSLVFLLVAATSNGFKYWLVVVEIEDSGYWPVASGA